VTFFTSSFQGSVFLGVETQGILIWYLNLHKNSLLSKLADKKTDIPGKQRVIGVATLLHASILRVFA
jgi:hypothetical protein|tara:strand:- start:5629 stop:5829 length:201 start_codon:yes stop_codon:yes gene_type:complete